MRQSYELTHVIRAARRFGSSYLICNMCTTSHTNSESQAFTSVYNFEGLRHRHNSCLWSLLMVPGLVMSFLPYLYINYHGTCGNELSISVNMSMSILVTYLVQLYTL